MNHTDTPNQAASDCRIPGHAGGWPACHTCADLKVAEVTGVTSPPKFDPAALSLYNSVGATLTRTAPLATATDLPLTCGGCGARLANGQACFTCNRTNRPTNGHTNGSNGASHTTPEPVDILDNASEFDGFWTARPALAAIRRLARERGAGPWSTLGCVLAHVCSRIGPHVVLPATVGGVGSLNMLLGLVGKSSGGKNISITVARLLLLLDDRVPTHEIGTGQGLDSVYVTITKDQTLQTCDAALLVVPEIDTLGAHAKQQSATIMPTLRKLFNAEALGAHYADKEKRRRTEEHMYRAAVIIGVQPARSRPILGDSDGGTPQRFLWMPVNDPDVDTPLPSSLLAAASRWDERRPTQRPLHLEAIGQIEAEAGPIGHRPRVVLELPETAVKVTKEIRRAQLKQGLLGDDEDALDGHANFTRLKVAALLALFDGHRTTVTEEDWQLSEVVMTVSDRTRQVCVDALAAQNRKANLAKAYDEVERTAVVASETQKRVAQAIARFLRRQADKGDGWVAAGMIRKTALANADRGHFDVAINRLLNAGDIEAHEAGSVTKYRSR